MLDKALLGNRYTCFQCGTKFYDLNREVPTCPDCDADQQEAPIQDLKALLSSRGKPPIHPVDEDEKLDVPDDDDDDDDNLDDDDDDDDEIPALDDEL